MSPWPPPREDPDACQSCLARVPIARAPYTVIGRDAAGVAVWVCQPCAKATAQGNQP